MLQNTILKLTHDGYMPTSGSFSLAKINASNKTCSSRYSTDEALQKRYKSKFLHCREEYGNVFREKCYSILYAQPKYLHNNISNYINYIEKELKIPTKDQTLFYFTDNNETLAIKVSKFWVDGPSSALRRQIFTLFLRQGVNYSSNSGESLNTSLNSYSDAIRPLLDLFLEGYVNFSESCLIDLREDMCYGIVSQFNYLDREGILEEPMIFKP